MSGREFFFGFGLADDGSPAQVDRRLAMPFAKWKPGCRSRANAWRPVLASHAFWRRESVGLNHESEHAGFAAFRVNLTLEHEGSAVRAYADANAIGTSYPARALDNQEELIETCWVGTDDSASLEVDGVNMRFTMSVSEFDAQCARTGELPDRVSGACCEINEANGHRRCPYDAKRPQPRPGRRGEAPEAGTSAGAPCWVKLPYREKYKPHTRSKSSNFILREFDVIEIGLPAIL